MNRLEKKLKDKRASGGKILLPFLTGGYPDIETFIDLLLELERVGADGVEVGLPFSDPAADGPVIQASSQIAIERGASVTSIFDAVAKARERGLTIPLLYMTYYNPVFHLGAEEFSKRAAKSGADGVLVVDLPPEEAAEFAPAARASGLDTIFLVAPTTPEERMERVTRESSGFLYCVSVTGVTGEKKPVTELVGEMVERIRPHTDLPVLIGFGVSTGEGAASLAEVSDGVIVGSALISALGDARGEEAVKRGGEFIADIRKALD
ncbi:MAG: tryptophan synthase subunit alpha [Deltaproteobacteria bacterium]|nr:MAG: tryptophan synthase subunit alpha [Deltaproteobacteria bacterium]